MENLFFYSEEFNRFLSIEKNSSDLTLQGYNKDIHDFWSYISDEFNIKKPTEISHRLIRAYLGKLKEDNKSSATVSRHLSSIKSYLKFLCREAVISKNPASKVNYPKKEQKLPSFMFIEEVENVINCIEANSYNKMRNKFILELLYSSGMRVSEIVSLNIIDVQNNQGHLKVTGKGSKERMVYFGEKVNNMLKTYIEYRKIFIKELKLFEDDIEPLFLNRFGTRLSDRSVRYIVEKIIKEIAFKKKISPHTFRHTFATHLLNNGANIRVVQELLGHSSLSTTQVYTHVTKNKLVEVYNKFHKR